MFQFVFTQLISKKNKQTNKKEQRAEKGSEINRCGKRIKQQTEDCVVKKKKDRSCLSNTNFHFPTQIQTKLNQHRYNQTHPITWRIFSLQYGGLFPPTYATTAHGAIHNHVFAPDRCFYIAKQKQQQTRSEPKSPKMTNTKKKAISQISTQANFTFPQQIQTNHPSPFNTTQNLPFRLQADNLCQQISGFVDQSFFWAGIISATGRCHTQHTQHFLFRFVQQTFLPGHVPAQKKRRTHHGSST